jgi:very-short-patch-repair endonuclease
MPIPRPPSLGEETLKLHLDAYKIRYDREVCLIPSRKWRCDFLIPCVLHQSIAVEIEGGTVYGKSRHSRGNGFEGDARKYNALVLAGYRLLRFSTAMVQSGEAIDTIRAALGMATDRELSGTLSQPR